MSNTHILKHAAYLAAASVLAGLSLLPSAHALDNIIRPYMSARSVSMGGVRLTTGLYDDNFFGNPARVTQNPKWKVQLPDFLVESSSSTFSSVSDLAGGDGDVLTKVASTAGNNIHGRIQTSFPGFYFPNMRGGKWSLGVALLANTQFDIALRRSYQIDPTAVTDIGPAITVGRKLSVGDKEDIISVGLTTHATYRMAAKSGFSFVDIVKGQSISPLKSGGDGAGLDFDIGATITLPEKIKEWELQVGLAMNNLLGGKYTNLPASLIKNDIKPREQPRALGLGVAARRPELWKFTDTTVAVEAYDFGNNTNGSIFRLIHIGAETTLKVLSIRAGLNQGYLAGGLGLDLKVLTLDLGTYGEEMSLNTGGLEDRRWLLRVGFQI